MEIKASRIDNSSLWSVQLTLCGFVFKSTFPDNHSACRAVSKLLLNPKDAKENYERALQQIESDGTRDLDQVG